MDNYQFTEELSTELSGKPKRCGGRVSIAPAQQCIFCFFFFSFNDDFFFSPWYLLSCNWDPVSYAVIYSRGLHTWHVGKSWPFCIVYDLKMVLKILNCWKKWRNYSCNMQISVSKNKVVLNTFMHISLSVTAFLLQW